MQSQHNPAQDLSGTMESVAAEEVSRTARVDKLVTMQRLVDAASCKANGEIGSVAIPTLHSAPLQELLSDLPVKQPVHFVCTIGALRSGKSTLLTRLVGASTSLRRQDVVSTSLGEHQSGLFPVSHAASSCTQGIDMAGCLFTHQSLAGDTDDKASSPGTSGGTSPLILLDVQGTGSEGESHDLRLVTPAIAMCSAIVWRVGYDGRDRLLSQLQLLHMVASSLRRDGHVSTDGGAGGAVFGHLVIALKDAEQYEEQPGAIEAQVLGVEDEDKGGAAACLRNSIRRSVLQAFAGVTILPMASPREDEEAYMAGVKAVGRQVRAATRNTHCLFGDVSTPVLAGDAADMWAELVAACRGAAVDLDCGALWQNMRSKQLQRVGRMYVQHLRSVGTADSPQSVFCCLQLAGRGHLADALKATPPVRVALGKLLKLDMSEVHSISSDGDDDSSSGAEGDPAEPSSSDAQRALMHTLLLGADKPRMQRILDVLHELMKAQGNGEEAIHALRSALTSAADAPAAGDSELLSLQQEVQHILQAVADAVQAAQGGAATAAAAWARRAVQRSVQSAQGTVSSDAQVTFEGALSDIQANTAACMQVCTTPSRSAFMALQSAVGLTPPPGTPPSTASNHAAALHMARGIPEPVLVAALQDGGVYDAYKMACDAAAYSVVAAGAAGLRAKLRTARASASDSHSSSLATAKQIKDLMRQLETQGDELKQEQAARAALEAKLERAVAAAASASAASTPPRRYVERTPFMAATPPDPPMRRIDRVFSSSAYITPDNPTRVVSRSAASASSKGRSAASASSKGRSAASAASKGSSSSGKSRAPNPWNEFQKAHAGQGMSTTEMASEYRAAKARAAPTATYSSPSYASPSYASRSYAAPSSGGTSRGSSGGGNPWNAFQSAHKGMGMSRAQMSAAYRASKR